MTEDLEQECGVNVAKWRNTPFKTACEWHDRAYSKNSFFQRNGWTRKEVDDWFYRQILMLSNGALDRMRAHLFYGIVRAVGWMYWEGKR